MDLVWWLLAHCRTAFTDAGGPIASLALAGLLSGVTHCAGMCGPFVLAQVGNRLAVLPLAASGTLRRLLGAAALPYQLGRATTYGLLGAIAAAGFGGAVPAGALPVVAAVLMLAASGAIVLQASGRWSMAGPGVRWGLAIGRLAAPLIDRPFGWTGYGLGVVLGLLPCGVLYAALLLAASTGNALAGALGMLVFALATAPGLILVGWLGHFALGRWLRSLRHAPAIILLVNAVALLAMSGRLIGG